MDSRGMLHAVWAVVLIGLALWTLLAWGTGALVSGGTDWLGLLAQRALDEPAGGWLDSVLTWAAGLGQVVEVAVWVLWTAGTLGLLLTAVLATRLLRLGRD